MKKATLVLYNNNPSFDFFQEPNDNRSDDWNKCWRFLKSDLKNHDISLEQIHINPLEKSELVFFIDFPPIKYKKNENQIWILFLMEPKSIYSINYRPENHDKFDLIFTWDPDLISNSKYSLLPLSHNLDYNIDNLSKHRYKNSVIIGGFKKINYKFELYSIRFKIIKWYSKNFPNELDHYGRGWPNTLRNVLIRQGFENRLPNFFKNIIDLFYKKNKTYKGVIHNKKEILSNYNFSFVIENSNDQKGYISEKIFDSFTSFTIPIYFGAKDISNYLPENTFIKYEDFNDLQSLNKYISSFNFTKIQDYRNNIYNFLISDKAEIFKPEHFSQKVIKTLKHHDKPKIIFA
jgi:hypothetical protein